MTDPFNLAGTFKKSVWVFLSSILILLLALGIASCTGKEVYTLKDNNGIAELNPGAEITIKLESNPTTGYGWMLTEDMDSTIISLISTEYEQTKTAQEMVGSGGYEYFYFKAVAPGSTDIVLNYARPWEEGVEPIEIFRLSVVVK